MALGPSVGILNYEIHNKDELYASYMPFIVNGGIFIKSEKNYQLGEEIFVVLSLLDEPEKFPIVGKVVWKNPKGIQNNKPQGVGIQFQENEKSARLRVYIEKQLTGLLSSEKPTYTM